MTLKNRIMLFAVGWLALITAAHAYLNVNWASILNDYVPDAKRKFNVAYIPVTCHLACPVTDYISKFSQAGEIFLPRMFQGFPEIKEALISNKMQAAFIVAPLAIALKAQGVPIRIVYLGHRYGSAVVVRKDGPIKTFADMRGRTIAIPSRFSDERLIVFKAMKVWGIKPSEIKMVEMAPPDVAGALAASAIEAFSMGEPFPSQAEMGGFGRVLFHAREYWPDYMSCVLVVREDMIQSRPEAVQVLVDGVARSGLWLEKGKAYRDNWNAFVLALSMPLAAWISVKYFVPFYRRSGRHCWCCSRASAGRGPGYRRRSSQSSRQSGSDRPRLFGRRRDRRDLYSLFHRSKHRRPGTHSAASNC